MSKVPLNLHPIARLLANNFRAIRRSIGTQEQMGERMGLSQAQVSRLEQGKSLRHISSIGKMLDNAGLDSMDLLRLDGAVSDPELVEVRQLWRSADPVTRGVILQLLRRDAANATPQEAAQGE